jgi:hypothetical protein
MAGPQRYCQVGITSSPPVPTTLCVAAIAVTNSSVVPVTETLIEVSYSKLRPVVKRATEKELLERRGPVGSKEIGEKVQDGIDDVHHGQDQKGLSKTCQYRP